MSKPSIPSHWTPYTSDSGWFSISYPPTWQLVRRDQWVALLPPDGEAKLSLHCLRVTPKPGETPPDLSVKSLLPRISGLTTPAQLDLPYEHAGQEGPAEQFSGFFGGPEEREWRWLQIWMLRHNTLLLSIMFFQSGERDPERETLGRLIISSLRLADSSAEPADLFTERFVAEAKRRYPKRQIEQRDILAVRFGDAQLGLTNFYRQYIASPDKFDELATQVLETAERLQNPAADEFDPSFNAIRDKIMPMPYPLAQWQEMFPNHVGEPWVAGIATLYVVDQPKAYWYIRGDLLEKWGLTQPELHALAMKNLTDYFDANPLELHVAKGRRGPEMVLPLRPDTYNAARFLCPRYRQELLDLFRHSFVLGLPKRDFFAAMILGSREGLQHLRQQVRSDHATSDHPLCDRLLLVSQDGVSEYQG